MSNNYDDSKYGVITRKWFGLTLKNGGDVANGSGYTVSSATCTYKVARWYPKGPIKIVKAGYLVQATLVGGGTHKGAPVVRFKAYAGASVMANVKVASAGTTAAYTIASAVTFTRDNPAAGEYIGIKVSSRYTIRATSSTGLGTAVTRSSMTGTLAFFIDYVPVFSNKFDT